MTLPIMSARVTRTSSTAPGRGWRPRSARVQWDGPQRAPARRGAQARPMGQGARQERAAPARRGRGHRGRRARAARPRRRRAGRADGRLAAARVPDRAAGCRGRAGDGAGAARATCRGRDRWRPRVRGVERRLDDHGSRRGARGRGGADAARPGRLLRLGAERAGPARQAGTGGRERDRWGRRRTGRGDHEARSRRAGLRAAGWSTRPCPSGASATAGSCSAERPR
jgi:hypothetical protein